MKGLRVPERARVSREEFLDEVRKRWNMDDLTEIMPAAEWIYDHWMILNLK